MKLEFTVTLAGVAVPGMETGDATLDRVGHHRQLSLPDGRPASWLTDNLLLSKQRVIKCSLESHQQSDDLMALFLSHPLFIRLCPFRRANEYSYSEGLDSCKK